jgi:hypothetical protein
MGATTFYTTVEGEPDAEAAFQLARREAQNEHRSRGYTGTIAEKDDYVILVVEEMTKQDAHLHAAELIDDDDDRVTDTWGPAGAIPIPDGWLFFGWASE